MVSTGPAPTAHPIPWPDSSLRGDLARAALILRSKPFSIVTTEANELMEPIHDRMPAIQHPRDYDRWLTDYDEPRPPIDLLRPLKQTVCA